MATEDQMVEALRRADAAGDTVSAGHIADAIRAQRASSAPTQAPAQPKPRTWGQDLADSAAAVGGSLFRGAASIPDMLADGGDAVTRGINSAVSGGLHAIGADSAAQFVERGSPGNKRQIRIADVPDMLGTPRMATGVGEFAGNMLGAATVPFGPKQAKAIPSLPRPPRAVTATAPRLAEDVLSPAARAEAAKAAGRQGITMMPADVGGVGTRMASGIIRRTLGEIPMAAAARRGVLSAKNAVTRVASDLGSATDVTGAGQAAQRGARSWLKSSEERAAQLLDNVPVHPDTPTVTQNTVATLGDVTQGLTSNSPLSKVWSNDPRLQKSLEALRGTTKEVPTGVLDASGNPVTRTVTEGGGLSWADMKDFRSRIGKIIGQPSLTSEGPDIAAMRRLYGGLSQDMEATATQQGPRALSAFRRYNQFYRGRQSRIENVLSNILGNDGNKGSEAAFQQINRWAGAEGGNANALARTMRSMPEDEASTIRSTIVSRLGQASPGQQSAAGAEFSPATFSTQWAKMSNRAKSTLFPNATHRSDLNDIAVATNAMKRAGEYANHSNTGLITNASAHAAGLVTHPIFTTIMAGGEYGLGVLLSSPRLARIIARPPAAVNPATVSQYIATLGNAAKGQPATVASEIAVLQRHLGETFLNTRVPMRAAAGQAPEYQQGQQPIPQP